jgi:8-oxo-dGTP pyrophosphatase MutT (NUDIX family)
MMTEDTRIHGVTWVLLDEAREYVLLEKCAKKARVLGVGEWFVPGGKLETIDYGDPYAALTREIAEEWPTVRIEQFAALPILEGSPVDSPVRGIFLMRPYLIRVSGEIPRKSSEGTELQWCWIDGQLALYSIVPQVRMMIAAAIGTQL